MYVQVDRWVVLGARDRRPHEPLWEWITRDIIAEIESGALKPGEKLPSREQLREIYAVGAQKVSGQTVHRALIEVAHRGLTVSRTGLGTFVR